MLLNGFATALLWEWSLMLRASHAEGRFVGAARGFASCVGICACAFVFALRGGVTLMSANWPLMLVNGFWLALLAMVVNAFFVGYGANAR